MVVFFNALPQVMEEIVEARSAPSFQVSVTPVKGFQLALCTRLVVATRNESRSRRKPFRSFVNMPAKECRSLTRRDTAVAD